VSSRQKFVGQKADLPTKHVSQFEFYLCTASQKNVLAISQVEATVLWPGSEVEAETGTNQTCKLAILIDKYFIQADRPTVGHSVSLSVRQSISLSILLDGKWCSLPGCGSQKHFCFVLCNISNTNFARQRLINLCQSNFQRSLRRHEPRVLPQDTPHPLYPHLFQNAAKPN